MCLERRFMPRKARIFLSIAYVCLFTGISLATVNQHLGAGHPGWFDFLRGFLIGLAIVFLGFAARISRRCPPAQPLGQ
jgi:hypothetical protein